MNFEDLREYAIGDNIKDIDWKASARSGNLLVRQYIAEKKHNIMVVLDSGKKMLADTNANEKKKDVALMSAGIVSYLANKNGDYVGAIYSKNNEIKYFPFKSGLMNIEKILSNYDSDEEKETENSDIKRSLEYINKYIKKRMIIFIITDLEGLENIDDKVLKSLSLRHDVMLINIDDAYMMGNKAYDLDEGEYIPHLFLNNKKLLELEKKTRDDVYKKCTNRFKKYKITVAKVNHTKEITEKIIDLLERQKDANNR